MKRPGLFVAGIVLAALGIWLLSVGVFHWFPWILTVTGLGAVIAGLADVITNAGQGPTSPAPETVLRERLLELEGLLEEGLVTKSEYNRTKRDLLAEWGHPPR